MRSWAMERQDDIGRGRGEGMAPRGKSSDHQLAADPRHEHTSLL